MAFDAWTCFLPSLSIGSAQLRRRHDEHKNNKLLPFLVVFSEDADPDEHIKNKPWNFRFLSVTLFSINPKPSCLTGDDLLYFNFKYWHVLALIQHQHLCQ